MFSFRLFGDYCKPQNVRGFLKIVIKELHGFSTEKKMADISRLSSSCFTSLLYIFSRTLCNIRKRCKYCKTLLVDTSGVTGKHNFLFLLLSNLIGGIISFPIASCHRGSKTYHSWTAWNSALYNNIIIHLRNCQKKKRFMYLFEVLVS